VKKRDSYLNENTIRGWQEALDGSPGRGPLPRLVRPALLMIDCQRLFCDPESPAFIPAWEEAGKNAGILVRKFRKNRSKIIWTRHISSDSDPGRVIGHFGGRPIPKASPLSQYSEGFGPIEGESEIIKSSYSVWNGTDLDTLISREEVVVVAGVTAHRCILSTVSWAACMERITVTAMDAIASQNEDLHFSTLMVLANGHAHTATTAEIMDSMELSASGATP